MDKSTMKIMKKRATEFVHLPHVKANHLCGSYFSG